MRRYVVFVISANLDEIGVHGDVHHVLLQVEPENPNLDTKEPDKRHQSHNRRCGDKHRVQRRNRAVITLDRERGNDGARLNRQRDEQKQQRHPQASQQALVNHGHSGRI